MTLDKSCGWISDWFRPNFWWLSDELKVIYDDETGPDWTWFLMNFALPRFVFSGFRSVGFCFEFTSSPVMQSCGLLVYPVEMIVSKMRDIVSHYRMWMCFSFYFIAFFKVKFNCPQGRPRVGWTAGTTARSFWSWSRDEDANYALSHVFMQCFTKGHLAGRALHWASWWNSWTFCEVYYKKAELLPGSFTYCLDKSIIKKIKIPGEPKCKQSWTPKHERI